MNEAQNTQFINDATPTNTRINLENERKIIIENLQKLPMQDSIELNKNSKGYTYSIKLYGELLSEDGRNKLLNRLNELIIVLEDKYGKNQ